MRAVLLTLALLAVSTSSKFLWGDSFDSNPHAMLRLSPDEEFEIKAKINELQGKIHECKEKIEEVYIYYEEAQRHLIDVKTEVDSIIMLPLDDEIGYEIENLTLEEIIERIIDQSTSSDINYIMKQKQEALETCLGYLTSTNNRYVEVKAAIKQLVIEGAKTYQAILTETIVSIDKCKIQNVIDEKRIYEYETQEAKYQSIISQINKVEILIMQKKSQYLSLESVLINKIDALVHKNQRSESYKSNMIIIEKTKSMKDEVKNNINGMNKHISLSCEYATGAGSIIFGRFRSKGEQNCIESSYIPPTQLIYVLDTSGSMKGSIDELRSAVENTYKLILSSPEANIKIKNTIISYNSSATVEFKNHPVDLSDVRKIPEADGDTDFELPLNAAYKVIKEYLSLYENFTVIFMSDGQAERPKVAINLFKNDSRVMDKTKFHFVQIGKDTRLEAISQELEGNYYKLSEASQLNSQLFNIVRNINCEVDDD